MDGHQRILVTQDSPRLKPAWSTVAVLYVLQALILARLLSMPFIATECCLIVLGLAIGYFAGFVLDQLALTNDRAQVLARSYLEQIGPAHHEGNSARVVGRPQSALLLSGNMSTAGESGLR